MGCLFKFAFREKKDSPTIAQIFPLGHQLEFDCVNDKTKITNQKEEMSST